MGRQGGSGRLRALAFVIALGSRAALAQVVTVVEADTTIRESSPAASFGSDGMLVVASTPGARAQALIRVRVSGVGSRPVLAASLRLRVAPDGRPGSDAGGSAHVAGCGWDEPTATWAGRPVVDPRTLDALGRVQRRRIVDLDITPAIAGDGVYCFAIVGESPTFDDVQYEARETRGGYPALVLTTGIPSPTTTSSTSSSTTTSSTSSTSRPSTTTTSSSTSTTSRPPNTTTSTSSSTSSRPPTTSSTTVLVTTSTSSTTPPPLAPSCLGRPGPVITLSGILITSWSKTLLADTTVDARAATFLGSTTNSYPLTLGGDTGVCVLGGAVLGTYDRTWTWDQMHTANNAAVAFKNALLTVDGTRIDNVTDGVRPRAGGSFVVRDVWMTYVRDDCVENDHLQDGLVEDSLLDGCYGAFSARPSPSIIADGYDGSAKVWTIRDSLVRLEPMPGPDGPAADGFGTGTFFKWHNWDTPETSLSPKLELHGNVFLAERAPVSGGSRLGIPPGQLVSCADNVMVWLGPGPFPAPLPACFTVTTDRAMWDAAVAAWHVRHAP